VLPDDIIKAPVPEEETGATEQAEQSQAAIVASAAKLLKTKLVVGESG
jgi:hypothetical protein